MNRSRRSPSGRPADGEFADYAKADIDHVAGEDAIEILEAQARETLALLTGVDERIASTFTYAPGKWTMNQVVGHLSDDERIFAYRALCVARNDPAPLPGFDEKAYVRFAGFEERPWKELLAEFRTVRDATISMCEGLAPEAWLRRGIVNGYAASVRGLMFHVAGHELHHLRILREKYLGGAS
jgi:DinB superfamily